MTALLKYDAACRAVAEAKTFDDVREWEDKAAAVREYSRRAKNRAMELDALEIRERARYRRGQLLLELKATGKLIVGRKPSSTDEGLDRVTLAEIDVTENESSRDQRTAKIDGDSFERLLARCRAFAEQHPEKHTLDVLRANDGPINGARSVMGSRQEPDDSLDYFPTPPWATRALCHYVMAALGFIGIKFKTVWEPACGEGHMSEVLREYSEYVYASDVFDYGHGDRVHDFLRSGLTNDTFDWIITNPPFGDLTEQFVLSAINQANVGVAMFVRLQWLETIGRYENVFKDHPPTLIAFFAERVNLCKGKWDPDGGTATAYIWLVWLKDEAPRAPFWIPPGCQKELTHDDDRAKFAAWSLNPVAVDVPDSVLPSHDPVTGEIRETAEPETVTS